MAAGAKALRQLAALRDVVGTGPGSSTADRQAEDCDPGQQ
jgi:hypothetical protein